MTNLPCAPRTDNSGDPKPRPGNLPFVCVNCDRLVWTIGGIGEFLPPVAPKPSTSYEQEFYKVLDATREAAATLRKIKRDQRFGAVEKYLGDPEKRVLVAISPKQEQVAKRAAEINALMNKVRLSPELSAEQKRAELGRLQQEKNLLFDAASTIFSRQSVSALGAAHAQED